MAQKLMAIHHEASSSNHSYSNSVPRTSKYDVFLSFRGEDTRRGFTDHLYHALIRSGFRVFRDDEELERGEVISKELLQAIEDSYFAIVVLSKNYASSSWCLNELRHIIYSRDNLCQQVFPIFYDVDPSDVRHQKGSFAEAFDRHQMLQRDNKNMENWRDSLTKVADLSGWDCKNQAETELIEKVVQELWTKLRFRLPPYSEGLIGIEDKVQQMEPLLEMGSNDVRFVGMWGLGGVGKTTIARSAFEKYRSQFQISCFLHNVRTTSERDGLVYLQSKLLSHLKIRNMEVEDTYEGKKIIQDRCCNKKVLLVLDDVSHTSHLENLANSPNWFGSGSRVIITTRNSHLLRRVHKIYVHEVKTMKEDESLQLFCQKAFGRGEPQEDFLKLSKAICDYAGGLPLALSVLGSFFCRRSVSEWEGGLDMLKKTPNDDVFMMLKISFDGLTTIEQTIFLDIACFFNGWSRKEITQILESCGIDAKFGITTLQEKSMLKDYDNDLVMHDLLEQMGKRIVVDKSSNDVGSRSRLWSKEDIDEVMRNSLGTKEIEGMTSSTSCEAYWDRKAFLKLHNLRLLMISSSDQHLSHGLNCLSHTLKVLHWIKYPLVTLPSEIRLDKLVDLKMHHSKLMKLCNKSLCFKNLKFLDLSYSKNLIETPDFSEFPNLERLELKGCDSLIELHGSIGQHKKLEVLNLTSCKKLRARCPKKLEMTGLKLFVLFGCIQVKYLPEFGEGMKNLETLDAGETNLVKLPESLGLLSGLKTLKLRGCKYLVCLPQSICKLKHLAVIDIAGCSKFNRLPEKLDEIEALEELDASETVITEIPNSIGGVEKLQRLSLGGCRRPTSTSWSWTLPLKRTFWGHPMPKGITLPTSILNLKCMKELDLSYCGIDDASIPDDLGGLSSLWKLDLRGNKFKNLPAGCISNLFSLEFLWLDWCSELRSLPQPPPYLREMKAEECGSLGTVGGEQLADVLALNQQEESLMMRRRKGTLEVSIPGSEIPSWFENRIDVYLQIDEKYATRGVGVVKIEKPPWEEMLGIGICIVVDDRFFSLFDKKRFDMSSVVFYAVHQDLGTLRLESLFYHHFLYKRIEVKERNHLWMVFWKQGVWKQLLREYSHFLLEISASVMSYRTRLDEEIVKAPIKCGWRFIRKVDSS